MYILSKNLDLYTKYLKQKYTNTQHDHQPLFSNQIVLIFSLETLRHRDSSDAATP